MPDLAPLSPASALASGSIYGRLSASRDGHDPQLVDCIREVVARLETEETDNRRPGMLLGKIQSGKTRAFLGIIAHAFDRGFDVAIVLTKGTKALAKQTVARFQKEFAEFIEEDSVSIFDVMQMPSVLTGAERRRKLVFIAKKQVHNLDRLLKLVQQTYPELARRRVLLVDDEADLAGVRYVKRDDVIVQGTIADRMDKLRQAVAGMAFLQVTATPYALYLQPDDYEDQYLFQPKRPAFTTLLPIHSAYVGGADYFGTFDNDDPRAFLFVEVTKEEQDTLRSLDGRSMRQDRLISGTKVPLLRRSLLAFIAAVVIRREQQRLAGERLLRKYAMVIHNDVRRLAHQFQGGYVRALLDAFRQDASGDKQKLREVFDAAFTDLSASVGADGSVVPNVNEVFDGVCDALLGDEVVVSEVNSDNDVAALLNSDAELNLRTPFNIFIGGSILDRGITIPNLISFYYGRNPKTMQADTVLQHSRMYGARDRRDLAVTRFYTSRDVHQRLQTIDALENALRHAFESGAHERGVAFIRTDASRRVIPCSPSKVLLSDVVSVDAGGRLLPIGFTTREKDVVRGPVQRVDALVPPGCVDTDEPELCDLDAVHSILGEIESTLDVRGTSWNWNGLRAVLDYFARITASGERQGKVWVAGFTGRKLARTREGGRFNNAPDTKQQRDLANHCAKDVPMLLLFKQEGTRAQGWSGTPFWWPVLIAPTNAPPCVYAHPKDGIEEAPASEPGLRLVAS